MDEIVYTPIGTIRSPFKTVEGTPIQPVGAKGVRGQVELRKEFLEGIKDLDGFSHVILIYHLHLSRGFELKVKPFLDNENRGVFATRAPKRPNSIGISVVKLVGIQGRCLIIEDVDVVDGTPLLDIKPYVPQFDSRETEQIGWFSGKIQEAERARADDRFREQPDTANRGNRGNEYLSECYEHLKVTRLPGRQLQWLPCLGIPAYTSMLAFAWGPFYSFTSKFSTNCPICTPR